MHVVFLAPEPIERGGFKRGRGMRDHIANRKWMTKRTREQQSDIYMRKDIPSGVNEKHVCKPESDTRNRVWRDGTDLYRGKCITGL